MALSTGVKAAIAIGLGLFGLGGALGAWDAKHYDSDGFNGLGLDRDGYDREGFSQKGYDRAGYDRHGFDRLGYDKDGYDSDGYDKRHRDRDGYDKRGFDRDGFYRTGHDRNGYGRDGFNDAGKDRAHESRRHYDFEVDNMNEFLEKAWSFKGKHDYESSVTPARKALECGIHNVQYHWLGKPDRLPKMHEQISRCSAHLGEDMCNKLVGVWKITSDESHYQDGIKKPLRDEQIHFCLKTLEELRDVVALYGTRSSR